MTMQIKPKDFFWIEKYRPTRINDIILPEEYKNFFKNQLDEREVFNSIYSGPWGCGKTTTARALCEELGIEHKIVNASDKRGISDVRYEIIEYGKRGSFDGSYRVLILDEAERLTPEAQESLKNPIEEFQNSMRIIMTTNKISAINGALKSRLQIVDFNFTLKQKSQIAGQLFKRILFILDNEGVQIDDRERVIDKDEKGKPVFTNLQNFMFSCIPDLRHLIKTLNVIAFNNNNSIPFDYEYKNDGELSKDLIINIMKQPYEKIAQFTETIDAEVLFSFIGNNVLEFSSDLATIKIIMDLCTSYDREQSRMLVPVNNLKSFLLNLKKYLNV
jgi:DNA polymerase III delta prime subunit